MILTPVQSLALAALWALIFAVCGGAIFEWTKWFRQRLGGVTLKRVILGPQATVGFVDIAVTLFVLISLFFSAVVAWKATGMPISTSVQQSMREQVASIDEGDVSQSPDSVPESNQSKEKVLPKPKTITQNQFLFSGFAISAQLVCVFLMTIFVCRRTGCAVNRLGWRADQIEGDLRAGWQCFLMMTPIILVINALLQGLTKTPYEHPVQEMIKQYPWLLGIAFWQAAIVAPISEEFGFRVLLIGWFESIHFGTDKMMAFVFGTNPEIHKELNGPAEVQSSAVTLQSIASPYQAPTVSDVALVYRPPWWPVLLSGALFGLAHFNYGVSWVALIVFGVVLGRLYQLRQSIIPVIMVHVLFNAMNVTMLGLSLMLPANLGK